jgi:predicted nucleic acid-binding protein
MKTVVVDTNVLVSAILRDRTPELVIQYIVENPDVEWVLIRLFLGEEALVGIASGGACFDQVASVIARQRRVEIFRDPSRFTCCTRAS